MADQQSVVSLIYHN